MSAALIMLRAQTMADKLESLKKLREPFPANQISKLPKPTKAQTDAVKADFKAGARCEICGGWHHPKVVHLDYVGHAALTDRLLDVDPEWNWEPLSVGQDGLPVVDRDGGLWIKLTICGITRFGYGDAEGKTGPSATKERIGDALRNAAMRFGAALDLWHKGDLHGEEVAAETDPLPTITADQLANIEALIDEVGADKSAFLGWLKLTRLEDITQKFYPNAVNALEKKRK
jgi:hypothetical protein